MILLQCQVDPYPRELDPPKNNVMDPNPWTVSCIVLYSTISLTFMNNT